MMDMSISAAINIDKSMGEQLERDTVAPGDTCRLR